MSEMDDAKRRRTEEQNAGQKQEGTEMKEEAVETADLKELEEDAKPDKRQVVQHDVQVETRDATLNVIPALGGRVLMPLTDGGLQYLVAGARANLGIKKGRYMFEVRIVEAHNPAEPPNSRSNNRPSGPRQLVRIGLSTQGSSLFLGETNDSICFDSEGFFTSEKKRVAVAQRFSREHTIGLLLNLDRKSDNVDTVSLFRNGERISAPQPLPEHLQDKPLFPHVNFKNVTLHLHFGPAPLAPLPFTCRTWQEAAKVDALVVSSMPKDGLFEALFPVGLPDEGTFDWLDMFLEKNPQYTEISDRMIVRWAEQSGLWRPKTSSWKNSNDKPDMNFGIPLMDDFSVRRVLSSMAAAQPRNYIIMEVKSNLINEERQELVRRFCAPPYKKVAVVVMGRPSSDFKERILDLVLKEKQENLEQEWRKKKEEEERKKTIELQQKQLADAKRKAEEQANVGAVPKAKPEAGPDNKDGNASQMAIDGEGAKQPDEKGVETEAAGKKDEGGDADVKDEDDQDKKPEDEEEEEEAMPVAELSEEEKKLLFMKKSDTDLTMWVLSNSFPKFSIPEDSEGFDQIRYEWENESQSKEYLKQYILQKKVHCRIEDLQPSDWFRAKWSEWQKVLQEWHNKQSEYKETAKFKEKKAAEEAAAKKTAEESEEKKDEQGDEKMKEEKKDEKEKESGDDIFAVEDVCDVGTGEPLFARFTFEDWALLSLRLELLLLVHAFKKDVSDPERVGIHETHLPFYYQKYYRKTFNVKYYGVESNSALVDMVKDTVVIRPSDMVLEAQLSEEMDSFDIFVKLTEESRRERQRRMDAGDETVKLKFSKPETPPQKGAQQVTPRPYQVTVGGNAPMKGNTGSKGYFQPRPQQQDKGWYAGGNNKGTYGSKGAVTYGGLQGATVGGKSYGGQQSYGGGKSYGGGNTYGKGYGK